MDGVFGGGWGAAARGLLSGQRLQEPGRHGMTWPGGRQVEKAMLEGFVEISDKTSSVPPLPGCRLGLIMEAQCAIGRILGRPAFAGSRFQVWKSQPRQAGTHASNAVYLEAIITSVEVIVTGPTSEGLCLSEIQAHESAKHHTQAKHPNKYVGLTIHSTYTDFQASSGLGF